MDFRSVLSRGLSTFGYLGFLAFAAFISAGHARRADAAIFQLANGGEIFGELVNVNRTDADSFVIRAYSGGEITLAAANVLEVVPQRPVEIAFRSLILSKGTWNWRNGAGKIASNNRKKTICSTS